MLALPETAPAVLLSPSQHYHQATTGWGRWRALSLYAFAASGRSPRSSSSLTPSLIEVACIPAAVLLHGAAAARLHGTALATTASPAEDWFEEMAHPRSTLGRRVGVRPRLLLWRCRHPYTACALFHHRKQPLCGFQLSHQSGCRTVFELSAQGKEGGCYGKRLAVNVFMRRDFDSV